jgi:hypothetical protein
LCEALGGEVGVRKAPGGGSIFWFTMPLAEDSSSGAASGAERVERPAAVH